MDDLTNALLIQADSPLALPAFDRIRPADFAPALQRAMQLHRAEVAVLGAHPDAPDFDNVAAAFDRSGALLQRVQSVFSTLAASATSPDLQAVQRELAGPLSAHWSAVQQDAALFARLDALYQQRQSLGLSE